MTTRDQQIAHLIREEIKRLEYRMTRCSKDPTRGDQTASTYLLAGRIEGLLIALALVDPEPRK
jgi:hypothetical protein